MPEQPDTLSGRVLLDATGPPESRFWSAMVAYYVLEKQKRREYVRTFRKSD